MRSIYPLEHTGFRGTSAILEVMDGTPGSEFSYQPEEHKSHTKFWFEVVVAVVVIAVLAGVFAYQRSSEEGRDPFVDLEGTLLLTLATEGDFVADLYAFDIATRHLRKVREDSLYKYTAAFSPSENLLAYFAAPVNRNLDREVYGELLATHFPYDGIEQLYIDDLENGGAREIIENQSVFKTFPAWSSEGNQIAFSAREDGLANHTVPSNWSVYVSDLEGQVRQLGPGMYPQWSPDDSKILALIDGGLAVYDVDSGVRELDWLFPNLGSASHIMKFSVSHDGTKLAWPHPHLGDRGTTYLLSIASWSPYFEVSYPDKGLNEGKGGVLLWPVFSPDDRFLAGIEVDWLGYKSDENVIINPPAINPRLVVYHVGSGKRLQLADLRGYTYEKLLLSDWTRRSLNDLDAF